MTLSTLEHNENMERWAKKLAKGYGVVTVIVLLFSVIYEYNSHGVYSLHMMGLALYPLVGGVMVFSLLARFARRWSPHWLTVAAYQAAILSFMFGSLVKGVLDIYGTSSLYAGVYWWAGGGFAIFCVGTVLLMRGESYKHESKE